MESLSPAERSPAPTLLIRAPLSSLEEEELEEADTYTASGSPAPSPGPLSEEEGDEYFLSGEEEAESGFESASDRPFLPELDGGVAREEKLVPGLRGGVGGSFSNKLSAVMPKARLSMEEEDVAEEVFDDDLATDDDVEEAGVARVVPQLGPEAMGDVGFGGGNGGVLEEEVEEEGDDVVTGYKEEEIDSTIQEGIWDGTKGDDMLYAKPVSDGSPPADFPGSVGSAAGSATVAGEETVTQEAQGDRMATTYDSTGGRNRLNGSSSEADEGKLGATLDSLEMNRDNVKYEVDAHSGALLRNNPEIVSPVVESMELHHFGTTGNSGSPEEEGAEERTTYNSETNQNAGEIVGSGVAEVLDTTVTVSSDGKERVREVETDDIEKPVDISLESGNSDHSPGELRHLEMTVDADTNILPEFNEEGGEIMQHPADPYSDKEKVIPDVTAVHFVNKEVDSKAAALEEAGDKVTTEPPLRESVSKNDVSSEGTDYDDLHLKLNEGGKRNVVTRAKIAELEEGSSTTSSTCGSYPREMEGQIATDSDEEMETDDEEDEKELLLDPAALSALLNAAAGASSGGGVSITAPDATRILSAHRPAGLSLKSVPTHAVRPNSLSTSELAVVGETEDNEDEEEMKLQEKIEELRVKFLRLVLRLGHSPDDRVAAQVIYRLGLAEGIKRGRQISLSFNFEKAKKKALQLEENKRETLDFSCNILVIGKTGVGKSATINSIFGEEKVKTDAFEPATSSVKQIVGTVDGIRICVVDTPGLKSSAMDQAANARILASIKKYAKKCPPDIVLYVDRLDDTQTLGFNDLPLLQSITRTLGSSIWFNAIIALTHAASAPPDGPSGTPFSFEALVDKRSRVIQLAIRQVSSDMRFVNPVALVENHPSSKRNRDGEVVLPNGLRWRSQMLLLCYSSKILSDANSILKLQEADPGKLFRFRSRSAPLPSLLSSLLQSRAHPKLVNDQGADNGGADVDLDELSDSDQEEQEDEYDQLPPFKPLRKAQIAKLTREQRRAYFDEYDYRVKLLQKKQWKEELKMLRKMKKRGKAGDGEFESGDLVDDYDQDSAPAAVPVPLPDMVLPPSFDCNNPAYRYRFLEPTITSHLITRPVLDTHGWDHDCGYDGVSLEENLAIAGKFPAGISIQVTKDKKDFNIHLDSSVAAKHGENGSTLAAFDVQSMGKQLAYILSSEAKFRTLKNNKSTGGISICFLGEKVATGLKVEDQLTVGKRLGLAVSTGAVRAQDDVAYGANLEVRLREMDFPIGQDVSTLGLSLMKWRRDLALGANLQSQLSVGRNTKMGVRVSLNNKLTGQITVRTSTSEQLQIALMGILPIAVSICRGIWSEEAD